MTLSQQLSHKDVQLQKYLLKNIPVYFDYNKSSDTASNGVFSRAYRLLKRHQN